ncbi:putative protein isoform 1 [Actinidia chinensis var. chinensis]|uniref:Uncharacterized protein n=1 Tax=Actinidia chinensis var. chinensis TaxID=1590841 RepID=A0A2R6P9I2_ACTCC|nr:putative protein isoform 1 [Actinidia chinensis var. chinensis]
MAYGGSAVGPPAVALGEAPAMRQVKLERECEMRIEVCPDSPLRLRLLTGTAEIFGTEIAPEMWLASPLGSNSQFLHGIEQRLKWMATLKLIIQQMNQGPRLIVVGPTDSGKSTLSRMLLSWAAKQGWKPTFVDLDIGQASITIPGCIAATPIEMPIDPVEGIPLEMPLVYFYGHTTPSPQLLWMFLKLVLCSVNAYLYKVLVKELAQILEDSFLEMQNPELQAW